MKIQTFSIVAGTRACDANCPFCVSKMTGFETLPKTKTIHRLNFEKAVNFAIRGDCSTCLITGKGEPTLYPDEIEKYLKMMREMGDPFPFVEIQTNLLFLLKAIESNEERKIQMTENMLSKWKNLGLNTIAVSVVDSTEKNNAKIYDPNYSNYNLSEAMWLLKDLGFTTRLCVMMLSGVVSDPEDIDRLIKFCKMSGIAQLTVRSVRKPNINTDKEASDFVKTNGLNENQENRIARHIESRGTKLMNLMHGNHKAGVYDIDGQNICLSDCLTIEPNYDEIRTLIFYSDGRLYYDWQYEGARLL